MRSPCVVNVPIQPMNRMERAAQEIFISSSLSQIWPLQPKIQLCHHQLIFNLSGLFLFSAYVIVRMRAYDVINIIYTLPIIYTKIRWRPSISQRVFTVSPAKCCYPFKPYSAYKIYPQHSLIINIIKTPISRITGNMSLYHLHYWLL